MTESLWIDDWLYLVQGVIKAFFEIWIFILRRSYSLPNPMSCRFKTGFDKRIIPLAPAVTKMVASFTGALVVQVKQMDEGGDIFIWTICVSIENGPKK